MAGVSEILVLILIITGILILPRLFKTQPVIQNKNTSFFNKIKPVSVKNRIAICSSLIYPFAMALYLKPWSTNLIVFLLAGILPVIIIWAILWIIAGTKKTKE